MSIIMPFKEAERQILNTQTKKVTRPSPWNCPLEITEKITFNVSGYVCTRKNNAGQMKRVLMKQAGIDNDADDRRPIPGADSNTINSSLSNLALQNTDQQSKTVAVEVAKEVLEKEQVWTKNDGTVVAEEDIGRAYYFGDKLIPFNGNYSFKNAS